MGFPTEAVEIWETFDVNANKIRWIILILNKAIWSALDISIFFSTGSRLKIY